jgi:hypothetical protein
MYGGEVFAQPQPEVGGGIDRVGSPLIMEPDLCSSAPAPTCTGPSGADHVGIEALRKEKGSPTWRCSVREVGEMGGTAAAAAAGPCARFHGKRGRG